MLLLAIAPDVGYSNVGIERDGFRQKVQRLLVKTPERGVGAWIIQGVSTESGPGDDIDIKRDIDVGIFAHMGGDYHLGRRLVRGERAEGHEQGDVLVAGSQAGNHQGGAGRICGPVVGDRTCGIDNLGVRLDGQTKIAGIDKGDAIIAGFGAGTYARIQSAVEDEINIRPIDRLCVGA